MKKKSIYRYLDIIFIAVSIIIFFIYNFNKISYGLPYFWNPDEISFQGSILSSIFFLTDYFALHYNPFFAPLINSILILNSIFKIFKCIYGYLLNLKPHKLNKNNKVLQNENS